VLALRAELRLFLQPDELVGLLRFPQMTRPHYYRCLDERDKLVIELDLRGVAEKVCGMNHGVHRLFSHIIDVKREQLAERVATYRSRGDDDVADYAERRGAEVIARLEALFTEDDYLL
jgi:hypothetical protein